MKKILTYLLNIVLYGIALPLLVFVLASIAVVYSSEYYWGQEYIQGDSGFKLGAWMFFYSITLTIYYYFFALISFGFDHKLRRASVSIMILTPILFHYLLCGYDYRITICFAGFHLTYYVMFYGFVWLQQYLKNRMKLCFKEREPTLKTMLDQLKT